MARSPSFAPSIFALLLPRVKVAKALAVTVVQCCTLKEVM
jgi:hypothetical protein